jgi:aminoglycoside phosphotransferase (APT) family kinase protein
MTQTAAATAQANVGTEPVRAGFELDEPALIRWMSENVEGFTPPVQISQFKGGQSNPTYKIVTERQSYVLRRKPVGQLAQGAHAVDREARVVSALGAAGFPVARVYGLCTDDSVIGSWFYVMEMVNGRIFWDATFSEVPAAERRAYFSAMNRAMADLHNLDPAAIRLGDYGRHGNYFERQIARWGKTYLEDVEAGRDPGMDRLIEWLPTAIPSGDETRIVHGDYRCDNVIFHPEKPQVLAVLDWELSTLGHPLADFAYHALMYRIPPDIVAGLGDVDPRALMLPTEEEYIAEYCRNTGRDGIENYNFYVAFNLFRLAAIFHGIKGRYLRGTASSANSAARAAALPRIIALAVEAMEQYK